jgi:hypothetical protein
MKPELDAALCRKHPKIFRLQVHNDNCASAHFGFECRDGWFSIIDSLCTLIQSHIDANSLPQVEARQVKEKFGTLRFYLSNGDDIIRRLVDLAEVNSETICEVCGGPGTSVSSNGWVATRCNNHKSPGNLI